MHIGEIIEGKLVFLPQDFADDTLFRLGWLGSTFYKYFFPGQILYRTYFCPESIKNFQERYKFCFIIACVKESSYPNLVLESQITEDFLFSHEISAIYDFLAHLSKA